MLLPFIWHSMHDLRHFIDLKATDSNVVSSLNRIIRTPGIANLPAACLMTPTKYRRMYGILGLPIRTLGFDASYRKPRGIVRSARYQRARTIPRHWYNSASTASCNILTSRPLSAALPPTLSDLGVQKDDHGFSQHLRLQPDSSVAGKILSSLLAKSFSK